MNKFITIAIIAILILAQSCAPKKPIHQVQQPAAVTHAEPPVVKDPYVPFTRDLFDKLSASNIDIKQVQFYIDQQIVLTRFLSNDQIAVKNGVIKFNNGRYVNEIVFPQYTKVICDAIEGDGLRVKAENGNNTLKFLNSKQYSPINYIFNPDKWNKDGSCEAMYNGNRYTVVCPTCTTNSPNEAKLVVKQSASDNLDRQTTIVPGLTPGTNYNGNNTTTPH